MVNGFSLLKVWQNVKGEVIKLEKAKHHDDDIIKKLEILMQNFNEDYIEMIDDNQLKILFEQVVNELNKRALR